MFDKDLFYTLCEKYHVELSDKYNSVMIKGKNELKRLNDFLEAKEVENKEDLD